MGKVLTIDKDEAFLRKISKPVDILNDKNLLNDIQVLDELCSEIPVYALAANRLGILKRIIYLKLTDLDIINKVQDNTASEDELRHNEQRILINPVILEKKGLTEYWEACASCLDYLGHVYRPYKIKVSYYDINNQQHFKSFEGIEATIISHEMDHLDGILHIDIADKILIMDQEQRGQFRMKHNYKVFHEDNAFDDLIKDKLNKKELSKYLQYNRNGKF